MRQSTDTQAQRLDTLALRLGGPARAFGLQRQMLHSIDGRLRLALRQAAASAAREPAQLGARLLWAMRRQRERQSQQLAAAAHRLAALDPQRVLARGYAWVADADGPPVLSARAVLPGDRLRTLWADGSAQVEVLQVQPSAPPVPRRSRSLTAGTAGAMVACLQCAASTRHRPTGMRTHRKDIPWNTPCPPCPSRSMPWRRT